MTLAPSPRPDRVRAFVALRLSAAVETAVEDFVDSLRPAERERSAIRWVRRSNPSPDPALSRRPRGSVDAGADRSPSRAHRGAHGLLHKPGSGSGRLSEPDPAAGNLGGPREPRTGGARGECRGGRGRVRIACGTPRLHAASDHRTSARFERMGRVAPRDRGCGRARFRRLRRGIDAMLYRSDARGSTPRIYEELAAVRAIGSADA